MPSWYRFQITGKVSEVEAGMVVQLVVEKAATVAEEVMPAEEMMSDEERKQSL